MNVIRIRLACRTSSPDVDPRETQEWIDSLRAVADRHGTTRARYLRLHLLGTANRLHAGIPALTSTDYINTTPREQEPECPGDEHIERHIRAFIRWNDRLPKVGAQAHPSLGRRPYAVLGTDGFGRSDTRSALRRHHRPPSTSTVTVPSELAAAGALKHETVAEAIQR